MVVSPRDASPADLEEAHVRLLQKLDAATVEAMRSGSEADMAMYHFGLGMWMRNNWGLWGESRLRKHFCEMGVKHADDMSSIVLDTFWCKLNDKPFRLPERVAYFDAYWKCSASPTEKSPRDGASIAWLVSEGDCPERMVHYGISDSDGSYWRVEYGAGRGVEAARPDERPLLDEIKSERHERERIQAFERCLSENDIAPGGACPKCANACQQSGLTSAACDNQEAERCDLPRTLSRAQIEEAMKGPLEEARRCERPPEPGTEATVVFQPDGTVKEVTVRNGFSTVTGAACIHSALMKAKVSRFAGPDHGHVIEVSP